MTYAAREQSDYGGHPLLLYRFAMGEQIWLYTGADHEVAKEAELYQPVFIQSGGFVKGGDLRKSTMDIEVSATNPVALLFRNGWLPAIMIVTVFRHHYEDSEFSMYWKGRITGCKWSGSVAQLSAESAYTLFQRAGLRRPYQVGCPHLLYGAACGVNPDTFRFDSGLTAVSGLDVDVVGAGSYADGWFTGGMLQAGDEKRMIIGHVGSVVTLIDGIEGLAPGVDLQLWPGCDRSIATCTNKFGNVPNYGGLPFLPKKNPFSGDALV